MKTSTQTAGRFPLPFYDHVWPGPSKEAARALWSWHTEHQHPIIVAGESRDPGAFFAEEVRRVLARQPLRVISETVARAAYAAAERHDLPLELLARQTEAARRFVGPLRFADQRSLDLHIEQWAMSHGRLLGGLAGLRGSWQVRSVDELSRAFFLTGRLLSLPHDLQQDRLYLPLEDLDRAGVSVEDVRDGNATENMRRLLWRQAVRARDAFAQGQGLVNDLSGRYRRAFKRWWLAGLEVLTEIERNDYDVWSVPVRLSRLQRFRISLQAFAGRTTFR